MNQLDIQPTIQESAGNSSLTSSERQSLKKSFEEDGYFIVKNVVSPAKLAELHQDLTTTFNRPRSPAGSFPAADW